jgi:gluconokinase
MPDVAPASLVLMGVSAAGKTAVGASAAELAGVRFLDADDLHPEANIEKMAAGLPLDDADRAPWLDAVADALRAHAPCIMACSALKHSYRQRLRARAPGTVFALLRVPRPVLAQRLSERAGHYMPASLLDSQLSALESPAPGELVTILDGERSIPELAGEIATLLAVSNRPDLT